MTAPRPDMFQAGSPAAAAGPLLQIERDDSWMLQVHSALPRGSAFSLGWSAAWPRDGAEPQRLVEGAWSQDLFPEFFVRLMTRPEPGAASDEVGGASAARDQEECLAAPVDGTGLDRDPGPAAAEPRAALSSRPPTSPRSARPIGATLRAKLDAAQEFTESDAMPKVPAEIICHLLDAAGQGSASASAILAQAAPGAELSRVQRRAALANAAFWQLPEQDRFVLYVTALKKAGSLKVSQSQIGTYLWEKDGRRMNLYPKSYDPTHLASEGLSQPYVSKVYRRAGDRLLATIDERPRQG